MTVGAARTNCTGFTLLEIVFIVAIVAVLASLALGEFSDYIERARSASAKGDIAMMSTEIDRYRTNHGGAYPDALAGINRGLFLDPWKRPYYYVNLSNAKGNGSARKDHKLNPLNSDFDLFSAGKNGVYKSQVSQKDSLDDVIRARDGAFIGRASDF